MQLVLGVAEGFGWLLRQAASAALVGLVGCYKLQGVRGWATPRVYGLADIPVVDSMVRGHLRLLKEPTQWRHLHFFLYGPLFHGKKTA